MIVSGWKLGHFFISRKWEMAYLGDKKEMDPQGIMDKLYAEVKAGENLGEVARYIPELGKVDPAHFGMYISTIDGRTYSAGEWDTKFSIQSIAKVLSLSLAFDLKGDAIWERVDVEPSGSPFNSLVQLEFESGIPRNPFINAGAIVICDILCSELKDPKVDLLAFVRRVANNPTIDYNPIIARSEASEGYRNFALINFIRSFGNIHNEVDEVIDLYFHLSSIMMTCKELSESFLFLANAGLQVETGKRILGVRSTKRINAVMQTCGFYDEAGEFAFRVGLPGKSGVGGGIAAVLPNDYAIAVWSPRLNPKGNSYRGMKFLERFTTLTELSIF